MRKSKFASIIDSFMLAFSIFFLAQIAMQKLSANHSIKLTLSAILGAIFFMLFLRREKKRYENNKIKLKDKETYQKVKTMLTIMTKTERDDYLKKLLEKLNAPSDESNKQTIGFSFANTNTESFIQDIINTTQRKHYDKYYSIVNEKDSFTKTLEDYAKIRKQNIEIITHEDLFELMKKTNYLPNLSALEKVKISFKEKTKIFFQNLLYRRNSKGFFISGMMVFLTSLYMPFYKIYYQTVAFLLLSISSICLIFGKKNV